MQFQNLIADMPRPVYERLLRAVELGRWPDGRPLTAEQRATTLQAVIAWGERHLAPHERVGYIDTKHKAGDTCAGDSEREGDAESGAQPLTWREPS